MNNPHGRLIGAGVAAAFAAWLLTEPFAGTVATQGLRISGHPILLGSLFGFLQPFVLGAAVCATIAYFLALERKEQQTAPGSALLAGVVGGLLYLVAETAPLAAIWAFVRNDHSNQLLAHLIFFGAFMLPVVTALSTYGPAVAIGIADRPGRDGLVRELKAGTIAFLARLFGHSVFGRLTSIVSLAGLMGHDRSVSAPFNVERLIDALVFAIVLSVAFPLADQWSAQRRWGAMRLATAPPSNPAAPSPSASGPAPIAAPLQPVAIPGVGPMMSYAPIPSQGPVATLSPTVTLQPVSMFPSADPGLHRLVNATGADILIQPGITTVGREIGQTLTLSADSMVSRHHAEIASERGEVTIRDVGSTNGTTVNGVRIGSLTKLNDGDEVCFGNTSFTFKK